jgi:hypothetical protein
MVIPPLMVAVGLLLMVATIAVLGVEVHVASDAST